MDIDNLTLKQVREIAQLVSGTVARDDSAWQIGKIYLIRTVTMIDTGRLIAVTPQELVLEDAAWIADTDRFMQAVEKAEFGEVEPFPSGQVIIGRGSIIDAVTITQAPRSQK